MAVSESKESYIEIPAEDIVVTRTKVENIEEDNGELRFTIKNINVSLANAIRRTILTDIPTVVFRTVPYELNDADIKVNTSALNNDILKQRLSCIPIYIKDHSVDLENLLVVIQKKNETSEVIDVTTADFKIKDISSDTYLTSEEQNKIFPACPMTKEHILFARLRPKIGDTIQGEELHIEAKMSIDSARTNSAYNVVSACSYRYTPDKAKADIQWKSIEKGLKDTGMSDEDIMMERDNYYLGEAKRLHRKNSFDFLVETIGVFNNTELVVKACDIMISKCNAMQENIRSDSIKMSQSMTTMENTFDVVLENDHYSYGKSLEYGLHRLFYEESRELSYVGFNKDHPYDDESIIRIGFNSEAKKRDVYAKFEQANNYIRSVFMKVKSEF